MKYQTLTGHEKENKKNFNYNLKNLLKTLILVFSITESTKNVSI